MVAVASAGAGPEAAAAAAAVAAAGLIAVVAIVGAIEDVVTGLTLAAMVHNADLEAAAAAAIPNLVVAATAARQDSESPLLVYCG